VRVAIDYTPALRQHAGIGRYTRGLIRALADLDRENAYTLLSFGEDPREGTAPEPHPSRAPGQPWPDNFRVRSLRVSEPAMSRLWHRLAIPLPADWLSGRCDLYHSPDFTLPPLARARGIVTVHDLSFLRVPECAPPALREHLERAVPRSVARAHHVLADSSNTRDDLVELLGAPREKVSVVPGGVEGRFRPIEDAGCLETVRARYRLPPEFILAVGTLEPRKNYPGLISAYADFRRRTGLPHRLVIAGREGWMFEPIYERVEREGVVELVQFVGFVADEDLPALYNLADTVAYPSLYEGFGLPPLEAMACGVPVVCSNTSSLPETAGDAAITVDPTDADALSGALELALSDSGRRAQAIERGLTQARKFGWSAAAEKLIAAYGLAMGAQAVGPPGEGPPGEGPPGEGRPDEGRDG
jgi:glycosyltransferase involved in cell wall biosynthesis